MKIKSVSGITCYVKDLNKTVKFYETLGFDFKKREANHATAYSNWFWIDFIVSDTKINNKGEGVLIYLSADNVDEFYKELLENGIKPASEPKDLGGNREFILHDPDGYKLAIFKRK